MSHTNATSWEKYLQNSILRANSRLLIFDENQDTVVGKFM
jgi:hypothetical protein